MSSTLAVSFLFNYENDEGETFNDVGVTTADTAEVVSDRNKMTELENLFRLFKNDKIDRDYFDFTTTDSGMLRKVGDDNTKVKLYKIGFSKALSRTPLPFDPNGVVPNDCHVAILFGGQSSDAMEKFEGEQTEGEKDTAKQFVRRSVEKAYTEAYGFATVFRSDVKKVSGYLVEKKKSKSDEASTEKASTSEEKKPRTSYFGSDFDRRKINKKVPYLAKGVGGEFAEKQLKLIYESKIKNKTLRKADVVAILTEVFQYAYEKRVQQFEPYFQKQTITRAGLNNAEQCIYSSPNYRGFIVLPNERFVAVSN